MFSERFTSIVGMSPARYLARWCMHVASGWLQNERLSVAEVAERLGYESEASFSRATKARNKICDGELERGKAAEGLALQPPPRRKPLGRG